MTVKTIEDIVADLQSKKEAKMAKIYNYKRKVEGETKKPAVQAKTGNIARKDYEREINTPRLKTGTLIDELLGGENGGLKSGSSMLIYGEFGSGKTEIAMTMAVLCPDIVIYIDTEHSFTWSRIKEICDSRGIDFDKMFDKIILYQPDDWIEQMMILESMLSPADVGGKIGLIIVDSLTKLFRGLEFAGRGELTTKQPLIREYPVELIKIANSYGCAMIYTSQIYVKPIANPFLPDWANEACVGGASLQHQGTYVVHLRRAQGNVRIARLIDADDRPLAERPFLITEKGVENLPDTEKAQAIIEKTERYEKEIETALNDPKRKKSDERLEEVPTLLDEEG